jgi:hypothetical protein
MDGEADFSASFGRYEMTKVRIPFESPTHRVSVPDELRSLGWVAMDGAPDSEVVDSL